MPNSHYYSRTKGQVVPRPPQNPEAKAGADAGRKQRKKDQQTGIYPRGGLPISREGRSDLWISKYQGAYYQPKSRGGQMLGNEPKVQACIRVDRELLGKAKSAGLNLSALVEAAIAQALAAD